MIEDIVSGAGTILVAEDDPADAFFLQRAFGRAGIPVSLHFVRDGQEVIDYLRGERDFDDRTAHPLPELLLLDIRMPGLDGFDVLAWIRQQPAFKRLPVVIFSSSNAPGDINRAYDLGANSYLVKPHAAEDLKSLAEHFRDYWLQISRLPERQGD